MIQFENIVDGKTPVIRYYDTKKGESFYRPITYKPKLYVKSPNPNAKYRYILDQSIMLDEKTFDSVKESNDYKKQFASMDTDCRPSDQWVKVIEEVFAKEKKIDALAGKVIFFDGSFFGRKVSEWGYYAFFYSWMKLFTGFHPFTTANAAFRTSVYKKIGGFDATIVSIHGLDDVDLAGRMSNGDNIRYEKRMTVYASSRRYKDFFKMVPDMIQRFKSLLKITRKYKQRKKIF